MRDETREELRRTILDFAESSLRRVEFSVEELRRAFPFHAIFFPDEALLSFKMQRSLVTRMGMTLYPRLAVIVARDRYREVYRNYQISGMIEANRLSVIDRIVDELRSGRRRPDHVAEMREIFRLRVVGLWRFLLLRICMWGILGRVLFLSKLRALGQTWMFVLSLRKRCFIFRLCLESGGPARILLFLIILLFIGRGMIMDSLSRLWIWIGRF